MEIPILYEDQDIVVINKPPGVVVNDAHTTSTETIQTWWAERLDIAADVPFAEQVKRFPADWQSLVPASWTEEFGSLEAIFAERQGIVHRLDKETSGAMLLAKHPGSLVNLLMQFRLREVSKTYLCLTHGKFSIAEDTVSFPIGRSTIDRFKFQVLPDGRPSETQYRVLNTFTHFDKMRLITELKEQGENVGQLQRKLDRGYQGFSLVECQPKTGRTHQIRVHMTHLHHPLVADPTYVGHKRVTLDQLWCPRLFLHAQKLQWQDVRTGETRHIECELPEDLENALSYLKEQE